MIAGNIQNLFIAEYEAAQGWISGNISRFKSSVKDTDFYLLYQIGRHPLPPPGIEMVIKSLGERVRIVDATQIDDEEMVQHMVSEIQSTDQNTISVWFLQLREECKTVQKQLPDYRITYSDTFQIGRRGRKSAQKVTTATEAEDSLPFPEAKDKVDSDRPKEEPVPTKSKPRANKNRVSKGKRQHLDHSEKRSENNSPQATNMESDMAETKKDSEEDTASNKTEQKNSQEKKSPSPAGIGMADIFDSLNLFASPIPSAARKRVEQPADKGAELNSAAASDTSSNDEAERIRKEVDQIIEQAGAKGKADSTDQEAGKAEQHRQSSRPSSPKSSPTSRGDNRRSDKAKPPKQGDKTQSKETSTSDLMRIIFGARHDEKKYEHEFTEIDNSKAQMVSTLEDRLIRNIDLLVKGVKEYQWDYSEYMQFIITLIRSSDCTDFLQSWGIVSPNHPIQMNETVYKAIFDEADYYARVCDLLYAEDNW